MSAAFAQVVGHSPVRIWGLDSRVRLARQLERAGVAGPEAERVVVLRADWVYDEAIVRGLVAATQDCALFGEGRECVALNVASARRGEATEALAAGRAPADVPEVALERIAGAYDSALRKRGTPYLLRLSAETIDRVEHRVFDGAYKGVTDLVTLYAIRAPARVVTRWCALAGITPNQVTSVSLLLVLAAMALFWTGHYGVGLCAAWAMSFLDTVDGKLARVTVRSSRFGDIFDHSIDLAHPPFWWWAWVVGLPAAGFTPMHTQLVLTAIVGGYVLQRVEEGAFIKSFGMEMHVWRRFDSRFRLVTARRNPNLLLLTAAMLAGRPDIGIEAVAAWTVVSLAIHAVRLFQAAMQRRRGPLRSWLGS